MELDKPYISVEDIVKYYNSDLSLYSCVYKPNNNKAFIAWCGLYLLSTLIIFVSLFLSFNKNYWWWFLLLGFIGIYVSIQRISSIREKVENIKLEKPFYQYKYEKFNEYCINRFSKDDLKEIQDILTRREPKTIKRLNLVLPGTLIPVWSVYLNRLFTITTLSITELFIKICFSVIGLSLISWLFLKLIQDNFINRKNDKINFTIKAIEESLLNGYPNIRKHAPKNDSIPDILKPVQFLKSIFHSFVKNIKVLNKRRLESKLSKNVDNTYHLPSSEKTP